MSEKNNEKTNNTTKETIEKVEEINTKNNTSPIPMLFKKANFRNRIYKKATPKIRVTNKRLKPKLRNATGIGTL